MKVLFPIIGTTFNKKSLKSLVRFFSISNLWIESLHIISNFSLGSFVQKYKRQKSIDFSIFRKNIFFFSGLALKIISKYFIATLLSTFLQIFNDFQTLGETSSLFHQFPLYRMYTLLDTLRLSCLNI